MVDTHQYFNNALEIVLKAGKILSEGFQSPKEVTTKANDQDFVTQYDKLVEKTIIDDLLQLYPTHKFIAEESAAQNVLTNEPTWILDPIDGTTNFVQGFPCCCISLALSIENNLLIGIVYNPILNQLFTAQKGKGAYLNNEKIQTSNNEDLKNAMIGFDIISVNNDRLHKYSSKMVEIIQKQLRGSRSLGSAAISLCYVAMGSLDLYSCEKLKCWDVAAGILITQEAGGIVIDFKGSQYKDIMNTNVIVAGTKKLADSFLKIKPNF